MAEPPLPRYPGPWRSRGSRGSVTRGHPRVAPFVLAGPSQDVQRCQTHSAGTPPVNALAMSAGAMVGDRERCLDAGMDGYIAKPVRLGELLATLKRRSRAAGTEGETDRGEGKTAPQAADESRPALNQEVIAELRDLDRSGAGVAM